jgi:hypothetical protein
MMPQGDRKRRKQKAGEFKSAGRDSRSGREYVLRKWELEKFGNEARRHVTSTYECIVHRPPPCFVCERIEMDTASPRLSYHSALDLERSPPPDETPPGATNDDEVTEM